MKMSMLILMGFLSFSIFAQEESGGGLAIAGCVDETTTVCANSHCFQPPVTEIVAHRGASAYAPENTHAAFNLAWELGVKIAEGDFRLTRDKQVVCIHDETTLRVAGISRRVSDTTYAELNELNMGKGESIPLLRDILGLLPPDKIFFIEIKGDSEILPYIRDIILESAVGFSFLRLISFSSDILVEVKRIMPEAQTYLLRKIRSRRDEDNTLRLLEELGIDGLSFKYTYVRAENLIYKLRLRGLKSHVWTVNSKLVAKRFIGYGVDSILTARPDRLLELVN